MDSCAEPLLYCRNFNKTPQWKRSGVFHNSNEDFSTNPIKAFLEGTWWIVECMAFKMPLRKFSWTPCHKTSPAWVLMRQGTFAHLRIKSQCHFWASVVLSTSMNDHGYCRIESQWEGLTTQVSILSGRCNCSKCRVGLVLVVTNRDKCWDN